MRICLTNGPPDLENLPRDASWGSISETHYFAGWRELPIDQWHCRYEWDLYLLVGELEEARQIIADRLRNAPKMRSTSSPVDHRGMAN